ncbi:MAG: sigma-70 family RNA polymerase sigma factor [Candidatus Limnocylindrales bacterium]
MSSRVGDEAADSAAVMDTSDQALLERLATRADTEALSQLYDRYQALMYGLAMRITNDAQLAQDAVQEAFVGVWRNAGRYSAGRASVRTWILSITHHRAIDLIRRRRATVPLPEAGETVAAALTVPDVWPEVSRSIDSDTVRDAMAQLPEAQRQAIELAYFHGLTQVEIAERTQSPLGTIKSRVRLGLLTLRRHLEGLE